MKAKIILFLFVGAMVLPAVTSLFDLDARRRGNVIIVTIVNDTQSVISPN